MSLFISPVRGSAPSQIPNPAQSDASKHTVKVGETLAQIAKDLGISLEDLLNANPNISNEHNIQAGQELNVPGASGASGNAMPSPSPSGEAAPTTRTRRNTPRSNGTYARGGGAKPTPTTGANRRTLERRLPRNNTSVAETPRNNTPTAETPRNNTPAVQNERTTPRGNGPVSPTDMPTTGASARTARQDRVPPGVEGSRRMARNDESRLQRYREDFQAAGRRHNIDPSILAAIASRESRGGAALDRRGLGDNGNGFGLMQVDKRFHRPAGGPYSRAHIEQAAGILAGFRDQIARERPNWTPQQVMKAAISAYNTGNDRWRDPNNTDSTTTGRDYANDVIARARYFRERGF
ncbi:MAG: LysM peptidoglycan-binding domain-containing protein [Myxococcota bacterium]